MRSFCSMFRTRTLRFRCVGGTSVSGSSSFGRRAPPASPAGVVVSATSARKWMKDFCIAGGSTSFV
eukprot:4204172-Prymnesium_polylepis.1